MACRKYSRITVIIVLILSVFYFSGYAETNKPGLLIPIGRLLKNNNIVQLFINFRPFNARIIDDCCGGSWYKIPLHKLTKNDTVSLSIIKTNVAGLFYEEKIDQKRWTTPSRLINSDNPEIITKAQELTKGCSGNNEKAERILDFAVNQIKYEMYQRMHYGTASETLSRRLGICVNHSRLFVALCRSVGISARTVSGACTDDKNIYYHHEWAEILRR